MDERERKQQIIGIVSIALIGLLGILEFVWHRSTPFMRDDLWYSTNLMTGEKLQTLGDILDSQIWHFFNWGGRSVNHAILQLLLMGGELLADILNMVFTVLLCIVMCKCAGKLSLMFFNGAFVMLIAWNADVFNDMIWQAGSVNYLYSSTWITFFLFVYIRTLNEDKSKLKLVDAWIVPLGLMTGWSNENMGPAVFLTVVGIMVYLCKFRKKKAERWMVTGAISCFIGCIPLILAPGNFVRSKEVEGGLVEQIVMRVQTIIEATGDFLFIPFLLTCILILIYMLGCKKRLSAAHIALISCALLAHGAMILTPTYPMRASFGIMVLLATLCLSLVKDILAERGKIINLTWLLFLVFYLQAMAVVLSNLI